jgi:hypothetical protein
MSGTPGPDSDGEEADHLYDRMMEIRAPIIDEAIRVEYLLDSVLAYHFATDDTRRMQLDSLVFKESGLHFAAKIAILKKVLGLSYADRVASYQELLKGLDSIRRMRNKLAHSMLDSSSEYVARGNPDRVRFVLSKHGVREHFELSSADRDACMRSAHETWTTLMQFRLVLEMRASVASSRG